MGNGETMIEEWRVIEEVPAYAVSNLGRVKRIIAGVNTYPGKLSTPRPNKHGYMVTQLSSRGNQFANKNGKIWRMTHRIVLEAFRGKRPESYTCNHINGVKSDNRIENLEWVTITENNQHALDTGLRSNGRGNTSHQHKLTEEDVLLIKKILTSGIATQRFIAKMFKVHFATINMIKTGRTWSHIEEGNRAA